MKLSVIVPVYNTAGEGKLEYCLNSLVNQTLQDMEIIAVDDCSTDNSLEILQRFEKEHPGRVRAVHSEVNRKQGGAKNIARFSWRRESGSASSTAMTGLRRTCMKKCSPARRRRARIWWAAITA